MRNFFFLLCLPLCGQIMPILGGSQAPVAGCGSPSLTNLFGWYKADVGVTGTTTVTAWTDQSGAGHNLTGHGGLSLQTAQVNGLPGIKFDGSTGYFSGANVLPGNTSIYVILKLTATSPRGYLTGSSGGGGNFAYGNPDFTSTSEQFLDDAGILPLGMGTAAPDTSFHQLNAVYVDGASGLVTFRIDRTADGSTATTITLGSAIDLIGKFGSEFYNGTVVEILLYQEASSGTNRTTNETYLNCRSGL